MFKSEDKIGLILVLQPPLWFGAVSSLVTHGIAVVAGTKVESLLVTPVGGRGPLPPLPEGDGASVASLKSLKQRPIKTQSPTEKLLYKYQSTNKIIK